MTNQHPITPPPELMQQWWDNTHAEANRIIGDSLKDNPRYLQYLYIVCLQEGSEKGNRTIYVPTEGGLPVPTLGIEK